MAQGSYIITKKIAKHGNQAVIVIPSVLSDYLKPQMLVKIKIDILEDKTPKEGLK